MLGQATRQRRFVYEVSGLRQNAQTDNQQYPVRHSSTVWVQVPYERMNSEMQRITRLGGRIVSIRPVASPDGAGDA